MVSNPVRGNFRVTDSFKRHFDDPVQAAFPGVDFALKFREPIYAPEDGTVYNAKDKYNAKYCQLRSVNNWDRSHFLVHLDGFAKADGSKVKRGDLLGWAGRTGYLVGVKEALLHWGLKNGKIWLDPMTQITNIVQPIPTMDGEYYNGAVAKGEGITHQVKKAGYPASIWTDTKAAIALFYKYNPQYTGKTLHPGDKYKLPIYKATKPAPEPVKNPLDDKLKALEQELTDTKKKQLEDLQKAEEEKDKKLLEMKDLYDGEILNKDAAIDKATKALQEAQVSLGRLEEEKKELLDKAAVKLPLGYFETMESVQPLIQKAIEAELNSPKDNTVKNAYNKVQSIENPVLRSLLLWDWKYVVFFVLLLVVAFLTVLKDIIPAESMGVAGGILTIISAASAVGKLALDGVQRKLLSTADTNKDGLITIEDTKTYQEYVGISSSDDLKKQP